MQTWFLRELRLVNYRCFDEMVIDFEPDVTVLVGRNGVGKTAVLDALAVMLSTITRELDGDTRNFGAWDARARPVDLGSTSEVAHIEQMYPVEAFVEGTIQEKRYSWHRERSARAGRTTWAASDVSRFASRLARRVRSPSDHKTVLPVIASYGVERLLLQRRNTKALGHSRLGAYSAALDPQSDLRRLVPFLKSLSLQVATAGAMGDEVPKAARAQLEAIDLACEVALASSGWRSPRWNPLVDALTMSHDVHGVLPLAALSSGIRIAAGLAIDIASRAARANPALGPDELGQIPGIIMIDEVDLHLHPAWQQEIVASLTHAFPSMQFILTTHSPQVLSTVEARQIRLLDTDQRRSRRPSHARGLRSDRVLESIMRVAPEPPSEERNDLRRYLDLVWNGQGFTKEAADLRASLERRLGGVQNVPEFGEADAHMAIQDLLDE